MISMYYHRVLKVAIVMRDGMPAIVITDENVMDHEQYIKKQDFLTKDAAYYEALIRCPDVNVGWEKM